MWPRGLRGRLAAAIVLVVVAVLGVSFFILHERTGSDLESRIDDQLEADLEEFQRSGAAQASSPAELQTLARRFVNGQAYHADSRIFVIEIEGSGAVVTNSEELVEFELDDGSDEGHDGGGDDEGDGESGGGGDQHGSETASGPTGVLAAPPGLTTINAEGEDGVRVLSAPIETAAGPVGTFHVAESLGQVTTALDSLRATLLVLGAVALALLLAAAVWIATLVARPLDRMARFAAGLDTADLDRRLESDQGPAEVRSLSESLNHMLDRLQRAFEREREFVADASHELRTPITVAQGELDLLRRDANPAQLEPIDVVRRELRRMERLIAEMLTLAREDAGGALDRRTITVDDLLDDLRRDLPLLGPRDYRVAEFGGAIEADPDRLAQVLRNLVSNAVNHTEPGGKIAVRVAANGDRLRFEVEDDGPGIAAEEAARLFERFYRSADARSSERQGSGLGLAIARAIVEAHGGRIWAEANPGRGGLVVFEIPGYRE